MDTDKKKAGVLLQQAIDLAEKNEEDKDVVLRLCFWYLQSRFKNSDELARINGKITNIVDEESPTEEAAMAAYIHSLASATGTVSDVEGMRDLQQEIRQLREKLNLLPFTEETAIIRIWLNTRVWRHVPNEWKSMLEETVEQARKAGNDNVLQATLMQQAESFQQLGDTINQERCLLESAALADRGGKPWRRGRILINLSYFYENRNDLEKAGKFARDAIDYSIGIDDKMLESMARVMLATVFDRQNDFESAIDEKKMVVELRLANGTGNYAATWAFIHLSRSYRKVGKVTLALENLEKALATFDVDTVGYSGHEQFGRCLADIDETINSDVDFSAFCERFQTEHPGMADLFSLVWYPEKTEPRSFGVHEEHHDFSEVPTLGFTWVDPGGSGAYTLDKGLVIKPATVGVAWSQAYESPRFVRETGENVAIQVTISGLGKTQNTCGGILLMKDVEDHLWLANGLFGREDVSFGGIRNSVPVLLGRGRIKSDRKYLRIEKTGAVVKALCSTDGENWIGLGVCQLSDTGYRRVGIAGFGHSWTFGDGYDGSSIRFESFDMWST